jgi:hypothetical protein
MGQPVKRGAKAAMAVLAFLAIAAAVAIGAVVYLQGADKPGDGERAASNLSFTAWIADWQWKEGIEDFRVIAPRLDRVQLFGVYFDDRDRINATEGLDAAVAAVREAAGPDGGNRVRVDLAIVNDIVHADGTTTQKVPALLSRWMASGERRGALIERIAELAEAYRADGVEIDFERVRDEDWERVILFFGELHDRLRASGRQLRIVLEPRAPVEHFAWPEGPEYVMMAYNLYGPHSGPGPKADDALIRRLADRMDRLPGNRALAIAAGGFDWSESGGAAAVTERQALELARRSAGEGGVSRDEASGSLHFEYVDDDGARHTVWYADRNTLERWIETARNAGISRIAIWKLGGFERSTLDGLGGAA